MDDFFDDVITPLIPQIESVEKTFKPWHKPRKQWCRYAQWMKGLNWVIDQLESHSSASFNYLGLPGEDLLDLRMFARACKEKNFKLKYLGFNSIGEKHLLNNEMHLSESELDKTGAIAEGSKIITEPLESISRRSSSAFNEVMSFGNFHMVNFDLCKSMARADSIKNTENYFEALKRIIELQTNYMRSPWVLYITTKVCKESVLERVMTQLLKAIQNNIQEHDEFSSVLKDSLFIEADKIESAIENPSGLDEQEYFDIFALGFSKWMLSLCNSTGPVWKITMTKSCKYRTGYQASEREPDMLSLGYRFTYCYQQATDAYNLTTPSSKPDNSELGSALIMLKEVSEIINLDTHLEADANEKNTLIKFSADLLASARYDKDAYLKWVEDGCPANPVI